MKYILILLATVLTLTSAAANIRITEIMYNPEDSNEWIEFFNSGEDVNLTGVMLSDNFQTDNLVCCSENCSLLALKESYFLIADSENPFNHSENQIFCVDDNAIGNGLGNSGDKIILTSNNETILEFSYNTTTEKGLSLSLINETWIQTQPSPMEENYLMDLSFQEDLHRTGIEVSFSDKPLYTFVNYNSLIELHNLDYPERSQQYNVTVYVNISLYSENRTQLTLFESTANISLTHIKQLDFDIFFNDTGEYLFCTKVLLPEYSESHDNKNCSKITVYDTKNTLCNISLGLDTEKMVFEKNETIWFDNTLSNDMFGFLIEYWVEDILGNGVNKRQKTDNLNKKQFSPVFEESDKAYIIKSNLTFISCNNSNTNTFSQRIILVKGDQKKESNQSIISITDAQDKASFGDVFEVGLKIVRGDTRKTLVEAFIKGTEKISHVTGLKINMKFNEIEVTLPIQLKDNCDNRYPEGNYNLLIEGLDAYAERQVFVEKNTDCPSEEKKKTSISSKLTSSSPFQDLQPRDVSYQLVSVIQDVFSSEVISTIKIHNKEEKPHTYDIWSYLYKGSVSFSGDREANKIKIELGPSSEQIVTLRAKVSSVHPQEVMHKIKILREDRKTPYDITQNITLLVNSGVTEDTNSTENIAEVSSSKFYTESEPKEEQVLETNPLKEEQELQRITGNIVYESKTQNLKKSTIFFVIFTMIIGIVAFIKLRPEKNTD